MLRVIYTLSTLLLVQRASAMVRGDALVQRFGATGDALAPSLGGLMPCAHVGQISLRARGATLLRGGATAVRAPAAKRSGATAMSLAVRTWNQYLELLEERPIQTKMATGAVLSAIGDIIAQSLDKSVLTYSVRRVLVLAFVNILYFSPLLHYWYSFFDFIVVKKLKLQPGTWKSAFAYLALDQLVNSPITLVGFFHVFALFAAISQSLLGAPMPGVGELLASVRTKIGVEYCNALVANWKVWAAPQLINFMFVPPPLRVGFANLVALLWNAILSVIANR